MKYLRFQMATHTALGTKGRGMDVCIVGGGSSILEAMAGRALVSGAGLTEYRAGDELSLL